MDIGGLVVDRGGGRNGLQPMGMRDSFELM